MQLSVIVPCKNEAENLAFLLDEIAESLKGRDYEILLIDDGSTDESLNIARDKATKNRQIRYIKHDKSAGKGAALRTGLAAARGAIILTIDGDGQNNPIYLPQLADALTSAGAGCGIACGQRQKRTDSKAKQIASRFANTLRRRLLHDNTRDTACGLKAVHAHIFRRLPFFENWQRYFPALVLREGYNAVHIDVVDRPRRFGISKYGIFDRGLAGISDLIAVRWLMQRSKIVPYAAELALIDSSESDIATADNATTEDTEFVSAGAPAAQTDMAAAADHRKNPVL